MVNFDVLKFKFRKIKEKFLRFWRSDNKNISLVRDVLFAFLLVFIILMALWTYTGQWFGAPMVAIESGSMEHLNEPFGRIGTIDAGDMVLLVKVYSKSDIIPYINKDPDSIQYELYGDVIIYRPYGDETRDQIIHRAMCYIEYNEEYGTYSVENYGLKNVTKITIQEIGLINWPTDDTWRRSKTPHSGYITKGDNPITNPTCDQEGGICDEPIKLEWISGKARGELPWIGTLNLVFNDIISGKNTLQNVPGDSITCLIILIVVLVSIPVAFDIYGYYEDKKKKQP